MNMSNISDSIKILKIDELNKVEWNNNGIDYDLALLSLGVSQNLDQFLAVNTFNNGNHLINYIFDLPKTDKCVIWNYSNTWAVKYFNKNWTPAKGYLNIDIVKPKVVWEKNQSLDKLMTFKDSPFSSFELNPYDTCYKLIWYIDPRFTPNDEKIWAFSCTSLGTKLQGTKDMGYVVPDITVEYNPKTLRLLPNIDNYYPAYYDLHFESVWMLDPSHTQEETWIVKFKPNYKKPSGWKCLGTISPEFTVEYNADVGELNYTVDYAIPLYDFDKEHVWLLDKKYTKNSNSDIWAFKIYYPFLYNKETSPKIMGYVDPTFDLTINQEFTDVEFDIEYIPPWYDLKYEHVWLLNNKHLYKGQEDMWCIRASCLDNNSGTKNIGYISPRLFFETNPALPTFLFEKVYDIPWNDFVYENVYYLDPKFSTEETKIWAARFSATKTPIGEKDLGFITPIIEDQLDVIFISYYEPNAEENWQRCLEKAPYAKRIDGVNGIFEAHKQAALLAETDMFYVVDGDAWLVDDWKFDYQPGIFDRNCAYVWYSRNPVNNLEYGYGGVKLFSKSIMINAKSMTKLDMTTSVMPKLKVMEKVSNETRFNTDEFSTWRSAFRECVKLCYNLHIDPKNVESSERLNKWLTSSKGDFASIAKQAATQAIEYVNHNKDNYDLLLQINDRQWLEEQFKK